MIKIAVNANLECIVTYNTVKLVDSMLYFENGTKSEIKDGIKGKYLGVFADTENICDEMHGDPSEIISIDLLAKIKYMGAEVYIADIPLGSMRREFAIPLAKKGRLLIFDSIIKFIDSFFKDV